MLIAVSYVYLVSKIHVLRRFTVIYALVGCNSTKKVIEMFELVKIAYFHHCWYYYDTRTVSAIFVRSFLGYRDSFQN